MFLKLKPYIKSKTHRKLMLFFIENEGSVDTPRGLSAWTNENIRKVTIALEELAAVGFLKAHRTSSTVGYSCALSRKDLKSLAAALKLVI